MIQCYFGNKFLVTSQQSLHLSMRSAPPNAALSFFKNPTILSNAVISGILLETGVYSYGICLPTKQVPRQLATQITVLINANYLHISAFYQLKDSVGDIRYYMLVIPREDIAGVRPYISLYNLLKDEIQFDSCLFESLALQLLGLLDIFSRLEYVHAAIYPSNIYIDSNLKSIRLGPPMPFAAYLIDVERTTMIDAPIHSYDVCIPPECFLVYKSTINCLQSSTDSWMVGASLLYLALGLKFVESHFTSSYNDYRVELITFLFYSLGPPRRVGSLPLQREAEERLISSFEEITPYLDNPDHIKLYGMLKSSGFRLSVVKKVIMGLMIYNSRYRLRPGIALEIMKKEIDRLESTSYTRSYHSESIQAVQFLHTTKANSHAHQKRRRSRSTSPHRHKGISERIHSVSTPSSHLHVETLARQPNHNRSKSSCTDIDESIQRIRCSINYNTIATQTLNSKAIKKAMISSPIESARDIQTTLQQEYEPQPSVEDLIIPSKVSVSKELTSITPIIAIRDKLNKPEKSSRQSNSEYSRHYSKVLREHISGELKYMEEKLNNDNKPLRQSLQLSTDNTKTSNILKEHSNIDEPEYDRGNGLFVDSMDAPLLEFTKGLSLLPENPVIKERTNSTSSVVLASKIQRTVAKEKGVPCPSVCSDASYDCSISVAPVKINNKKEIISTDICSVVLHRLSTPYKAKLNVDIAVELKPAGHSSKASFIGSMSNVQVSEPPDFGISVPINEEIKVVSFDTILRDYSGTLTGRLVVSINTPSNTCKVISFNLYVDTRDIPKEPEWVLSTNGLASALLEILY